jgi:hypothetical protein
MEKYTREEILREHEQYDVSYDELSPRKKKAISDFVDAFFFEENEEEEHE